jgi:putative endonuclease
MAAHNDKGKRGEELAVKYFIELGYDILHQNWRHHHWEIDIIAIKSNMLHFIEVKCRFSEKYGLPEESVGLKKIRNLIDASAEFLYKYPEWKRIQFDILSISIINNQPPDFFLIEDVYIV